MTVLATEVRAARASEVRVTSRTMAEGYMVRIPGTEGELLSRRRLVQYVGLGAFDLLPPRQPAEDSRRFEDGQLRIVTSMRIRHDFGTFMRRATGDAAGVLETLDGRQIDVLFGYLEGDNLAGRVDFRVGRQFEMSGLDWFAYDGAWLRVRAPAHLAFETFAGFQVDGSAVFGYPTYELDGTSGSATDATVSPMVGAAFGMHGVKFMDARFAYRRTWTPRLLNRDVELPDGDALPAAVDQEVVAASIALRLHDGRVSPHAAARYNLGTDRIDDVVAGITWALTPVHMVKALYVRAFPAYDLDSIFNVFNLTPFQDARFVYEVRPGPRWTLQARGQFRFFLHDPTEELDTVPEDRADPGWGGGVAAVHRRRRFAARIDGFGLGGRGGVRGGGSIDTRTHVLWDRIALDARLYAVYFADDLVQERRGYSVAFQAGANWRFWHGIYVHLVGEEIVSSFYRSAFRALAILSIDVGFRVGPKQP